MVLWFYDFHIHLNLTTVFEGESGDVIRVYSHRFYSITPKLLVEGIKAELPPEKRYEQRQEFAKPLLDEFFAWLENLNVLPKSPIGTAAHYALSQRKYLERYLEGGRLEISNNRAERSIKPFVIGRKNFLFANTSLDY